MMNEFYLEEVCDQKIRKPEQTAILIRQIPFPGSNPLHTARPDRRTSGCSSRVRFLRVWKPSSRPRRPSGPTPGSAFAWRTPQSPLEGCWWPGEFNLKTNQTIKHQNIISFTAFDDLTDPIAV